MNIGAFRTESQKFGILLDRFLKKTTGQANVTKSQTGIIVVRLCTDRPLVGHDSLIGLRVFFIKNAQIEINVTVVAFQVGGLPVCLDCFGVIPGSTVGMAKFFVGYNIVRMLLGPDNRMVIPVCVLAGGTLLVISDTLARTFFSDLPVGIITAFIGAPFFIWLIHKRGEIT